MFSTILEFDTRINITIHSKTTGTPMCRTPSILLGTTFCCPRFTLFKRVLFKPKYFRSPNGSSLLELDDTKFCSFPWWTKRSSLSILVCFMRDFVILYCFLSLSQKVVTVIFNERRFSQPNNGSFRVTIIGFPFNLISFRLYTSTILL